MHSDGKFQDGLFHSYLSHALNISLKDGRLTPIDDAECFNSGLYYQVATNS